MGSIGAYPDSAAECTLMGVHVLDQLDVDHDDLEAPDEEGIDAANKSPFTVIGRLVCMFEYRGKRAKEEIHGVAQDTDLLICWSVCISWEFSIRIIRNHYLRSSSGKLAV